MGVSLFLFWAGLGLTGAVAPSPWLHRHPFTAGAEAPLGTEAFRLCPYSWTPWRDVLCGIPPHLTSPLTSIRRNKQLN